MKGVTKDESGQNLECAGGPRDYLQSLVRLGT